jgi:hypothetical protein
VRGHAVGPRPCQILNGLLSLPAGVRFAESARRHLSDTRPCKGRSGGPSFLAAPNRLDGAVPLGVKPRAADLI